MTQTYIALSWTGKHVFVLFCVVLNNFLAFFSSPQETDRLKESISDKGISIT